METEMMIEEPDIMDADIVLSEQRPAVVTDRSATALAAQARAAIQARVWLAIERPRNLARVRDVVLAQVKRPSLAARAVYAIQRGNKKEPGPGGDKWVPNYIEGPSIKLANALRIAMGNIGTEDIVIADDPDYRSVMVVAIDYESNTSEARSVVVSKTVERKSVYNRSTKKHEAPDREIISSRKNSYGDIVYKCRATEAEIQEAQNSAASRARRNAILSLIPADIVEEALKLAKQVTSSSVAAQRQLTIEKLKVFFAKTGVTQMELANYLGRSIDDATQDDLVGLEMLSNAITDGQQTWKAALRARAEAAAMEEESTESDSTESESTNPIGRGTAATRALVERASKIKEPKPSES